MKKPAPLSLSIPEPSIGQGDPAFEVARRHNAAARAGVAVFLGATVALGAELRRLRSTVQPKEGRPSKTGNTVASFAPAVAWKDLVKTQTGVNPETCRRAEKLADDILRRLDGKRDAKSKRARQLIQSPDQAATFDDYAALSAVCGALYDSETFTGILVEAGIVRPSISQIAAETGRGQRPLPSGDHQPDLFAEARVVVGSFIRALRETVAHREKWRQRLAALPLDSDDPDTPSLTELRAEVSDRLAEIDEIVARKAAAA